MSTAEDKSIHFIAIGGIGMSGIAEILHKFGNIVTGCDRESSPITDRLKSIGININIGHDATHITKQTEKVVISSAISKDNPEILKAIELGIPILHRVDLLAELMSCAKSSVAISGTHGKTTTTSLIGAIFSASSLNPTIINGGIMNQFGSNILSGIGEWVILEADESDASFNKLPPANISVVTNIDLDHMENYKSEENLETAFQNFIANVVPTGIIVLCADCPRLYKMIKNGLKSNSRILTYGICNSSPVNVRGTNIRFTEFGMEFDVEILNPNSSANENAILWKDLALSIYGEYNVQNSLAAIAIAYELGLSEKIVRNTFKTFSGTERRFTCTGTWNGIKCFSDYAHHPTEIVALLKATRQMCKSGRIIAIHQPHRNARFEFMFQEYTMCFKDADELILLPVYESYGKVGNSTRELAEFIQKNNSNPNQSVSFFETFDEVMKHVAMTVELLIGIGKPNDMIVCIGSGTIHELAIDLPDYLAKIIKPNPNK